MQGHLRKKFKSEGDLFAILLLLYGEILEFSWRDGFESPMASEHARECLEKSMV
jgi:hypothetical protein